MIDKNENKNQKQIGIPIQEIETLIGNGNKDNANMAQNPETIHKYVADRAMKEYSLKYILNSKQSQAHINGDLHCLSGKNKIIYKDNYGIHIERIDEFCENERWKKRITKVPSVNTKTGAISWQRVINGKKTGHKPCFEVTFGKGLQIECTSDHHLFTYQSGLHKFGKTVTPEDYTSGQRIGTINKIPFTGRDDHYYYSALYGMFLGDGCYQNSKLIFHFKKQEKIDYVEYLLEKLDYDYHILENKDDTITLVVDSIVDFNKSKENIFQDGFDGNMKGLIEGLINSDGYITKHGMNNKPYLEFTNTNKEICDWFTVALMTLGLRPSFQCYINHVGTPYYKCIISGDEIVKVLMELNLREPYKSLVKDYYNSNLIGGKLYKHTGLFINEIKPTGVKDVYNITVENNHNFLAGTRGFVLVRNCHDLEYFASRPLNCLQHDLRLFIRYGLKVDGTGDHTSIASAPTHMETVMNHSGEILLAAQQNMSGGQAFSLWNVFVAPFAHGLPYEKIKQCVEMFVFNLNMAYAARGGQVPFTSVGLEFSVPDFLKNEPAYGPGGKVVGVYGDYENEVRLIQRAFTEVLLDGDSQGKPHLFPNTIYYLRKECLTPEFEEDIDHVHYLSAKFGTAYYINMLPDYMGTHTNYMGSVSTDTPILCRRNGSEETMVAGDFGELSVDYDYDDEQDIYYYRFDTRSPVFEFLTYNPDGSKAWKPLKTIMAKPSAPLYHIVTENGKELKVTPNHKIPVIDGDGLIKVKSENLKVGDRLFEMEHDGGEPVIKSINLIDNNERVYDFEIEDNHNYVAGWGWIHIENCRTRLSDDWTGDWENDTLRCGNLAYVTLNLPRLGYRAKNENELFDLLDEQLQIAEEILLVRRERALKCLNDYKILPFLTQEFDGEPYYRVQNSTLSFGFVGLNEMLESLTGNGLADPNSNKLGHKVLDYINDRVATLKSETPYRWSIIETPAESTAYRFAMLDRQQYPDKVICQGDSDASYYTNSCHLPVDTGLSLPEKIKIEAPYHPKTRGGHIFHAFMGESYSDPDSLMSLTNKICHHSDIGFWAYSSALSYCNKCGTLMKGLQEQCSHCGETREVEWYDRITGYVQQVGHSQSASSGWNAGKKQELIDRRRFEQ